MCSPTAVSTITSIVSGSVNVFQGIQERKNAKYDMQIAKNNAIAMANKAKQEQQTGIEEAREERIKGIKLASVLNAQNASGGFQADFGSNLYNFQDINEEYSNNATKVQEKYNQRAENYYSSAKNYLTQGQNILQKYNSNLLNKALGMTKKVSSFWNDDSEFYGGNNDFFKSSNL